MQNYTCDKSDLFVLEQIHSKVPIAQRKLLETKKSGCQRKNKQPIAFLAIIQFWSTDRNLFSPTNDRENSFSMYGQTKRGQLYIGHLLNTYQPQSRATLTDCQRHEDRSEAAHLNGKTYFKQFLYFIWKFVLVSRVKNIHKIAVHFALV